MTDKQMNFSLYISKGFTSGSVLFYQFTYQLKIYIFSWSKLVSGKNDVDLFPLLYFDLNYMRQP